MNCSHCGRRMQIGWLTCPRCRATVEEAPILEENPNVGHVIAKTRPVSNGGSEVCFLLIVVVAGLFVALLGSLYY